MRKSLRILSTPNEDHYTESEEIHMTDIVKAVHKLRSVALIAVLSCLLLSLTACSKDGSSIDPFGDELPVVTGVSSPGNDKAGDSTLENGSGKGSTDDLGSTSGYYADMPADETSNHGDHAIMETENGYYYESDGAVYAGLADYETSFYTGLTAHRLCFYDKDSGEMILLCNKPECDHNGEESCVATYRNIGVINTVLYNGEIYIYGLDRDDSLLQLCLWRAGLDGSYIDKVATILEADNPAKAEFNITRSGYKRFIIHRGCAYVPYFMMIGKGIKGFKGAGLMKVDLKTGAKKSLYEAEQMTDLMVQDINGCGEYVFFYLSGQNGIAADRRYSIANDEVDEKTFGHYGAYGDGYKFTLLPLTVVEKYRSSDSSSVAEPSGTASEGNPVDHSSAGSGLSGQDPVNNENEDVCIIQRFDTDGKTAGEEFTIDVSRKEYDEYRKIMYYDSKLIIVVPDRILVYGVGEADYGKKLGEIAYEFPYRELGYKYDQYNEFYVAGGYIYRNRAFTYVDFETDENGYTINPMHYSREVLRCRISGVVSGGAEWENAYQYLYQEAF